MSADAEQPHRIKCKRILSTKPTAVANRLWRRRAMDGTRIAPVEATEPRVEKLISGGYLREEDDENSHAIAKAFEAFVDGAQPVRLKQG